MWTIFFIRLLFTYPIVGQIVNLPQSYIAMSDIGYYFSPAQATDWLDDIFVSSLTECTHRCNENNVCRTFGYDTQSNECKLFQVEPSPGQITYDPSSVSQVGIVQLFPDLFSAINQSCDSSIMTRYLICVGNIFQCPWNTFWDGSICVKQKYATEVCTLNSSECWNTYYNLTCAAAPICTATGYSTNLCAIDHNLILLNYTSTTYQPYSFYSFNFTANTTAITVTFSLMNRNAFWLLDNISLIALIYSVPLLQNGDFETGNLTNWNYCNPYSASNSSRVAQNGSLPSESGQYFYRGAPYPNPDFLSQTVPTYMGGLYTFSFWFGQSAASSTNHFIVTIFS